MEYKKSKIIQEKNNNYNKVGKNAAQLKDNRSAKHITTERTTQLRGLDEEEDELQLKADTAQKMGLDEEEEYPLQMKENNTGLPDTLKLGIENISGYSMDDVKVHYNSSKPAQLNAHAYAQGTDIHLGSGQEKHLPHEAWHVVQQKQGRVQPTTSLNGAQINDNEGLEKEADVMGGRALQLKENKHLKESKNQKTINFVKQKKSSESSSDKLIQLKVFKRDSGGVTGELVSEERDNSITIAGWIKRGEEEQQEVAGSLDYHIDPENERRMVIGTIKCTPKRTGAGSILIYLLADKAIEEGMELMGTDLSALEEGTPEFYMSIGLAPTQERSQMVTEIVRGTPEITGEQIKNLMYSAELNAIPTNVKRLSEAKLGTWVPE
ncbi:DUF4157 domain-containing protein [Bizionia paragorgiae]|uniref:eCIS core domain-containing protein n=1 Tax=Bizionia paragorgiae TaxID=283786 RepID=UPI003A8F2E4A